MMNIIVGLMTLLMVGLIFWVWVLLVCVTHMIVYNAIKSDGFLSHLENWYENNRIVYMILIILFSPIILCISPLYMAAQLLWDLLTKDLV